MWYSENEYSDLMRSGIHQSFNRDGIDLDLGASLSAILQLQVGQ